MSDLSFYMGLLKIFGKYINESILDEEEQKIFDELIYRSTDAVQG